MSQRTEVNRLEFRPIESKSTLLAELARSAAPMLLLGADAENPSEFYAVEARSAKGPLLVGLMSSGITRPVAVYSDDRTRLLVGHDEFVSGIALEKPAVAFVYDGRHLARFTDFAQALADSVLVVWDIGLVRLGFDGRVAWEYDAGDVITSWKLSPDKVLLELHEQSGPSVIDLVTGKPTG